MIPGDLGLPHRAKGIGIRVRARPPRGVQGTGLIPSGTMNKGKQIAADSAGLRCHHPLRCGCRDRSVNGIATRE